MPVGSMTDQIEVYMTKTEELVRVLGGSVVLKQRIKSIDDLDNLVQKGLPYQALEKVMTKFRLGSTETQMVLCVPPRTLARRKESARMLPVESDRLVRLARVAAHAVQVFGSEEKVATWLHRANRSLNNRLPLDLLRTDLGAKQVDDALSRMEHGIVG
jgi:putative toxin-antitoxin system antitoxin component (TIGR02293 family)